MNINSIFMDTWGWLALAHRQDSYHSVVKKLYIQLRQKNVKFYTSQYVLDELITLLFRREHFAYAQMFIEGLLENEKLGLLRIEEINEQRFQATWALRKQLQDKPTISFTDLSSCIIMQELGIVYILTQDKHFLQVGMGFINLP